MKKIFSIFAIFILAISLVGYVPKAKACSCIPPEPPLEAMAKADIVFAGKVADIDAPAVMTSTLDENKITFNVSRAWKGVEMNPFYVYSSGSSASCGYEFEVGKEYLVYAYDDDGRPATGLCTRTALLANASEDLAVLPAGTEILAGDEGIEEDTAFALGGAILVIVLAGAYYYSLGRNKKKRSILGNK